MRSCVSDSSAQDSGPPPGPEAPCHRSPLWPATGTCLAMLSCPGACPPPARKPPSFLPHCRCLPEQPPPRSPWTGAPRHVCSPPDSRAHGGGAVFSLQLRGLAQCLRHGPSHTPKSRGKCARACAPGALLPVIGGQLAASDVWHGGDPTALVLPVPNGAGHLQHTQDTPVPKTRGEHSDSIRQVTGPQHSRSDLGSRKTGRSGRCSLQSPHR